MEHASTLTEAPLGRRAFLRVTGAASLSALVARSADAGPVGLFRKRFLADSAGSCTLTPASLEGPFYLPLDLLRSDISEGRTGYDLDLVFKVVRASDCQPIAGAVVDVWHGTSIGRYSGIAAQGSAGQTFLRGIQVTPTNGVVRFHTIFPGWYPGAATHVHVKVFPTPTTELTTQLFFGESLVRIVQALPGYDGRGPNPLRNVDYVAFHPDLIMSTRVIGRSSILPPYPGTRNLVSTFTFVVA
jgi:protocatechuate 3,4-dioxygenase beta subunit